MYTAAGLDTFFHEKPAMYSVFCRSPSPPSSDRETTKRRKDVDAAHATAMTERRVVYVGGIGSRYSRTDLKQRFGGFGEIERVSIHTRSNGEDYGFVTFYSKADAYAAIESKNCLKS